MTPSPPSIPGAPDWPHCGHGASPDDPVGCRGIHVPGHTACLAHLAGTDRDAYLAGLTPGTDVDHRGTSFTEPLLRALLHALLDPATQQSRLGDARFEWASFQGDAWFAGVTFDGLARFQSATFQGNAWFERATFHSDAWFRSATFQDHAGFSGAIFEGAAWFASVAFQGGAGFTGATFQGDARFGPATFEGAAWFERATFESGAWFDSATFQDHTLFVSATFRSGGWFKAATFRSAVVFDSATFQGGAVFDSVTFQGGARFESVTFQDHADFVGATFQDEARFESAAFRSDVWFESAVFERWVSLGPLVCAGRVRLSGAVFNGPATLLFATRRLECRRTRWLSTAEVRLRYATVDFAHAVFEYPLTIAAEADTFVLPDGRPVAEQPLDGAPDASVRVASLRGVDAAHLVLADVDLSRCLFTGTVHLDQLRLEGDCSFDEVPPGTHWRRRHPVRFTPRRTLAEEHHWRASRPAALRGWNTAVLGAGRVGPLQLAPVYRALRKAFEDGKHEPGAADFYYGEMEMRRHADDIPRSERALLTAYWALSGYGMRASRALGWLGAAMLITIVLLMGFGLPKDSPKQEAIGTVPPGGGKVTFVIDKADPENPAGNRFTGERFEKALNVTLNSVVFRSSGQDLTTAGTYIEMTSRFVEPTLLALAMLAVRSRIKR
ncbi:pentapeptide repeat-containing protein [Streptomyces sp. NPDC052676]|uniref:pentapeptide repeat-containing protein n=1 Tax=Streptomyces sp. NPDC052676 TaxID=3154953 RepID=UPI0034339B75